MSGPTIRIDGGMGFPEVSAVADMGTTMEITDINDFDLGLLGNQRKIAGTPPRPGGSGGGGGGLEEIKEVDNIEFVNLDDTAVTYDVKPPVNNGAGDTIKIWS